MVTKLKPYNPSANDFEADWHVIDARGKVLGRLATEAAMMLMGKHRPGYVPHLLSGDFVIVINAADVKVTGNKADQIVYTRHSQKPGKLKEIPYRRVQAARPERIIEHAIRGMLPKNKLGERMIRRLKVYAGDQHPHVSQIAWTEQRPERDAAAAAEAEESANKRAAARQRAAARKDIAADAAAKAPAASAAAVEAPESVSEQAEAESKKPATRRSTGKAATAKAATATTTRKRSTSTSKKADSDGTEKKTTARKTTSRRTSASKKPAAKSDE